MAQQANKCNNYYSWPSAPTSLEVLVKWKDRDAALFTHSSSKSSESIFKVLFPLGIYSAASVEFIRGEKILSTEFSFFSGALNFLSVTIGRFKRNIMFQSESLYIHTGLPRITFDSTFCHQEKCAILLAFFLLKNRLPRYWQSYLGECSTEDCVLACGGSRLKYLILIPLSQLSGFNSVANSEQNPWIKYWTNIKIRPDAMISYFGHKVSSKFCPNQASKRPTW